MGFIGFCLLSDDLGLLDLDAATGLCLPTGSFASWARMLITR